MQYVRHMFSGVSGEVCFFKMIFQNLLKFSVRWEGFFLFFDGFEHWGLNNRFKGLDIRTHTVF